MAYDENYFSRVMEWSSRESYRTQLQSLLSRMKVAPGSRLLDIGSGTGTAIRIIKASTIGAEIQGIEPAESASKYWNGLEIIRGSAERLPYADDTFDGALMLHVVGHLKEPRNAFREAHRVLKPGAFCGVLTPNAHFVHIMRPFNILKIVSHRPDPTIVRYWSAGKLRRNLASFFTRGVEVGYMGEFPEFFGSYKKLPEWLRQRVYAVARK